MVRRLVESHGRYSLPDDVVPQIQYSQMACRLCVEEIASRIGANFDDVMSVEIKIWRLVPDRGDVANIPKTLALKVREVVVQKEVSLTTTLKINKHDIKLAFGLTSKKPPGPRKKVKGDDDDDDSEADHTSTGSTFGGSYGGDKRSGSEEDSSSSDGGDEGPLPVVPVPETLTPQPDAEPSPPEGVPSPPVPIVPSTPVPILPPPPRRRRKIGLLELQVAPKGSRLANCVLCGQPIKAGELRYNAARTWSGLEVKVHEGCAYRVDFPRTWFEGSLEWISKEVNAGEAPSMIPGRLGILQWLEAHLETQQAVASGSSSFSSGGVAPSPSPTPPDEAPPP